MKKDCIGDKKRKFVIFLAIISICTVFLYKDFLFGNRTLISATDAMDAYDQFYPMLLKKANLIRNGIFAPQMDFNLALGVELGFEYPTFNNISAWFGPNNVATLFGFFQVIKVIIAGTAIYLAVIVMKKKSYVAAICGFSYSYCGMMACKQYWYGFSGEIVALAIWFLCTELYITKKDSRFLPLGTFILFYGFTNIYYIVLYIGIISSYYLFRFCYDKEDDYLKNILGCIFFSAMIAVLAYGIANIQTDLIDAISSSRVKSVSDATIDKATFDISGIKVATLLFRAVGTMITGPRRAYVGDMEYDYLGGPIFYFGIFSLCSIIPIIVSLSKRKKVIVCIVEVIVLLYIFCRPIRTIANGFSSDNYKVSSLWIILFEIFVMAQGLDDVIERPKKKQLIIIFIELLMIIYTSLVCFTYSAQDFYTTPFIMSVVFVMIYLIYHIIKIKYNNCHMRNILIVLMVVENMIMMSFPLLYMETLPKSFFLSDSGYNNKDTLEALEYIKDSNALMDYRIDKQYLDYGLNDSWFQNYNGTSFYFGGTGISTSDLYISLGLPTAETIGKYCYQPSIYTSLNTLLGVKYILSRNDIISNYGYELLARKGDVTIFENSNALSLGYCYDNYMLREDFEHLSAVDKRQYLLSGCVLDEEDPFINRDYTVDELYNDIARKYGDCCITYFKSDDNSFILSRPIEEGEVLVITCRYSGDEPSMRSVLSYWNDQGDTMSYRVRIDNVLEPQVFEINASGTTGFSIENAANCKEMQCYLIDSKEYYNDEKIKLSKLKQTQLRIEEFSGTRISGSIKLDADKFMVINVPTGSWQVYIDGEKAEKKIANIAFFGTDLSKGEHTVELVYENDKRIYQLIIQGGLFLICVAWGIIGTLRMRRNER